MSESQVWDDVDAYVHEHLAPDDDVLTATLRDSDAAGLPPISVTAAQGKLLHLLASLQGARNILEIGTLGGYSTIWMARALPADGRLVTLEYSALHAEVAGRNIARAGLESLVDVRVGPALESLPRLADENPPPFDLVFIDADKGNNTRYLEWALRLTRAGGLIVVDNVVRGGKVADPDDTTEGVRGSRAALEMIGSHPRLTGTAIQTVGAKGYDGFALARVLA
ncbi:O-methyltransferase [Streptomyces tagetis]|uniref:O-methyltransferase n=1 Tax=Streptomyces tagetis TaxID=2820809 RepID=A0A940XKF9_9ACTN|nr:O-methyltransferase [Streptomyces sp. RG38]MBQ0830146.1 O-methyltransferase [Streptomyces sp. RG38]